MPESTDVEFNKGLTAAIGGDPNKAPDAVVTPPVVVEDPNKTPIVVDSTQEEKDAIAAYEASITPTKTPEAKIDVSTLSDEIKLRLAKLDELENKYEKNPVIKSIGDYIYKGGNITELMVNKGTDYSNSPEDVVIEEYHSYVLGEKDKEKLKPEIDKFNKAYPLSIEKKPKVDEFRRILNDRNGITTSQKFTEVIGSKLDELNKSIAPREAERQAVQARQKDSMTRINEILGKTTEFMGVAIPAEKKEAIAQQAFYHQTFKGSGKDIEFQPEVGINIALLDTLKDEIIKKAKVQGYSDAMKQFKRPSVESSSAAGTAYSGGKTVAERMAAGEIKIG